MPRASARDVFDAPPVGLLHIGWGRRGVDERGRRDATSVKLTVERLPESRVQLDITAEDDEFKKGMDRAYRRVSNQVTIPGFRRGKAPRGVIERVYGREIVVEEAHRQMMTDLYRRALEDEAIVPVGDPEVEILAAEPLAFKVTVPVYPTIDPGPYPEARVEPIDATVDEAAVDEVIERLRKAHSPWVDPPEGNLEVGADLVLERKGRTPTEGDQVILDYRVRDGDEEIGEPVEDATFVLGESNLLPRLQEEIEKLRSGESSEFAVSFADDDETIDPERRGKSYTYAMTLKSLKERELVALDDDFAKTVAEVDSMDALRQAVRDDIHQGKTADARSDILNQVIERMAETATIDLPAPMVEQAVDDDLKAFQNQLLQRRSSLEEYLRLTGQSETDLRQELRPAAHRRLRNSLLLREIANREEIAVDDAEVDTELERLTTASASGGADADRLRDFYRGDYFRGVLRGDLFERRITERLIEIATDGRGAVINGWVEPEPTPAASEAESTDASADEASVARGSDQEPDPTMTAEEAGERTASESPALDQALRTGAMPGQPGDLAETDLSAENGDTASGAAAAGATPMAASDHAVETEGGVVDAVAEAPVTTEDEASR